LGANPEPSTERWLPPGFELPDGAEVIHVQARQKGGIVIVAEQTQFGCDGLLIDVADGDHRVSSNTPVRIGEGRRAGAELTGEALDTPCDLILERGSADG